MQQASDPIQDPGAAVAANYQFQRSEAWSRVSEAFVKQLEEKGIKQCAVSGCTTGDILEIHHKLPFHLCFQFGRRDLEFDPANLMPLCKTHHLFVGHLDDWSSFNEGVVNDVVTWASLMTQDQFEQNDSWKSSMQARPGSDWQQWGAEFTQHFEDLMTQWYGEKPQQDLAQLVYGWYEIHIDPQELDAGTNADAASPVSPGSQIAPTTN
jgi:hypothetical protein